MVIWYVHSIYWYIPSGPGDCWLVSSFSALAEYPDRVRSLFKQHELTEAAAAGILQWGDIYIYMIYIYDIYIMYIKYIM